MNKKTLIICLIIFCALFISINKLYAKYTSPITGEVALAAAVHITDDNMNSVISYKLNDMVPGDVKTYTFNVYNYIGDDISEVALSYDISLIASDNIPVTFELIKNGGSNVLDANNKSLNNLLGFNTKETDSYQLRIIWNATNDSSVYSGLVDSLDINIESKQVV